MDAGYVTYSRVRTDKGFADAEFNYDVLGENGDWILIDLLSSRMTSWSQKVIVFRWTGRACRCPELL
jgi:hypothetical protein